MHWVIQKSLFKQVNYQALTETLQRLGIEYSSIFIPTGTFDLEPEINLTGKVYVCGALKLKEIAKQRNWSPGSFLNEDFCFDKWLNELKDELLNSDVVFGKFRDVKTEHMEKFFIRPLEDNKAFDGMVIDNEMLRQWRQDSNKKYLLNLDVVVSPVKDIYREYRVFVVKNKIITSSLYKVANKPQVSQEVEQSVIEYVADIINKWVPCESFVIDVCLTNNGYKVIEFNNINSSGFYACDVLKYVEAIQHSYS